MNQTTQTTQDHYSKREWAGLDHDEVIERANQEQYATAFARGVVWAEARLKHKNTGEHSTAFVKKVESELGNYALDLITLKDGRVLGISDDSVVLYTDMQDYLDNETKSRQCIDLYSEPPTSFMNK
jgi:hypothetical protein